MLFSVSTAFPSVVDACGKIVPRRDLVLPNGNQKRQREAAIETATRNGKKQSGG